MAFSDLDKRTVAASAGWRCQCLRFGCGHVGRCLRVMISSNQAIAQLLGVFPGFEFHHRLSVAAGGGSSISNAEFLCIDCHRKTKSWGTNLSR